MKLFLIPFKYSDLNKAFELYKSELHAVIDTALGWDESSQQKRFTEKYSLDWFYWVECEGNVVGYICYDYRSVALHISLLVIDNHFQGKGIGKKIMAIVSNLAQEKKLKLTLSSFKNNQNAVSFYEKLGFKIINQDDLFFDFELGGKE